MRYSTLRIMLVGLALMAGFHAKAWAWGNDGHKIVCGIAYMLLEPQEQEEIDRLTRLYRKPDGLSYRYFTEACTFADLARSKARDHVVGWAYFNRFNRWHFLNVPRDTKTLSEVHCADDCVLEGITYHSRRLANHDLEDWKRAESLFFLGHWIGDVHQPLHVSFEDDRGGNEITPIRGGYYSSENLHAVWDTGIIRKAEGTAGWWAYATRLKNAITQAQRDQWRAAAPLEWAQESYSVTTADGVDYCEWKANDEGELCTPESHARHLDAAYQQQFQKVVEERLQKAGARLADKIKLALNP